MLVMNFSRFSSLLLSGMKSLLFLTIDSSFFCFRPLKYSASLNRLIKFCMSTFSSSIFAFWGVGQNFKPFSTILISSRDNFLFERLIICTGFLSGIAICTCSGVSACPKNNLGLLRYFPVFGFCCSLRSDLVFVHLGMFLSPCSNFVYLLCFLAEWLGYFLQHLRMTCLVAGNFVENCKIAVLG